MTWDMAEIDQMLSAPSDCYSAGEWCELANALRARMEAAEARNKILEQTIREAYEAIQRSQETQQ